MEFFFRNLNTEEVTLLVSRYETHHDDNVEQICFVPMTMKCMLTFFAVLATVEVTDSEGDYIFPHPGEEYNFKVVV